MWMMLQQEKPDDYVISTGKSRSLRDFLSLSFEQIGIKNWEKYIKQDERFMRPAEVNYLRGDSSKANQVLGWKPKTSFEEMIKRMVKNDIDRLINNPF